MDSGIPMKEISMDIFFAYSCDLCGFKDNLFDLNE
jgi:hypothetical protein